MELIAAIDLLGGRAVRLRQGRYDDVVEGGDPVALATRFASARVPRLHVVDLDGARAAEPRNGPALAAVVRAARDVTPAIRVEAAGGLRSEAAIDAVLRLGADDAILGTAAIQRPGFLATCAVRWPGRIHASIDVRDGNVAVGGWEREERLDPLDLGERLLLEGAAGLVITDTSRDGTLGGPNLQLLAAFRERFPDARLVAAGGIRSIDDVRALQAVGIEGAIAGMALLAGTLRLDEAARSGLLATPAGR